MTLVHPFKQDYLFPDYKNVIRFKSFADRVAFFSHIDPNFVDDGVGDYYYDINLKWNDGVRTTIQIVIPNPDEFSIHEALSYNYLHVVDKRPGEAEVQNFYFITNVKLINSNVIEYTIQLDVFTTYTPYITIDEPLMTERRHTQRFKRTGSPPNFTWYFNNEDAILGDEIDSNFKANLPVNVQMMNVEYFDSNSTIPTSLEGYTGNFRDFVNEKLNDRLWLYAFIVNPENNKQLKGTSLLSKNKPFDSLDVGYRVLVAPLQEMIATRTFGNSGGVPTSSITYEWSAEKLLKAINSNKLNPRAISLRVSPIAPFNTRQKFNFITPGSSVPEARFAPYNVGGVPVDIQLVMNTLSNNTHTDYYFLDVPISNEKWFVAPGTGSTNTLWCDDIYFALGINYYSLVQDVENNYLLQTYKYDLDLTRLTTLPTNTTPKAKGREPKLYTAPFRVLEMSTGYSTTKELNELYFTQSDLKVEVNDIPTIADQKYSYSIAKSVGNDFYIQNRLLNNGLVGNNLYEFPLQKDRFAEYVSQHSNYLLSGLALPMVESAVSTLANVAMGNVGGAVRSGVSGLTGALSFGLQLQDLDRTPDTIKATGNNILHDIASNNDLKLKITRYIMWTKQQDSVFDYFYERGYRIMRESVWRQANDSSFPSGYDALDALFNRSRFNYIKLIDDEIIRKIKVSTFPMMQKAKEIFAEVLNRGVRMIESNATATTTIANFNTTTENMEYNLSIV